MEKNKSDNYWGYIMPIVERSLYTKKKVYEDNKYEYYVLIRNTIWPELEDTVTLELHLK